MCSQPIVLKLKRKEIAREHTRVLMDRNDSRITDVNAGTITKLRGTAKYLTQDYETFRKHKPESSEAKH